MTNSTGDFVPEMHDETANVRPIEDHDPGELARMSPERTAIFNALHDAIATAKTKERELQARRDDVKAAHASVTSTQNALSKLVGFVTPHQVWRRDVAKIERAPDSETDAVKQARKDLVDAQEAVGVAVAAERDAFHAATRANAEIPGKLRAYTSKFPVLSGVQAVKQHIDATQRHKQVAKENYEHVQRVVASELDAHLQSGKGPVGIRSARQGQRNPITPGQGTFPASMQGRVLAQQSDPRTPIDGRGGKRS